MNMMNGMLVVHHQRDLFGESTIHRDLDRFGFHIAVLSKLHRIIRNGSDHPFHILGRTEMCVLPFQNRPHHFSGQISAQGSLGFQAIINEMGHAVIFGMHRHFIAGVHNGSCAVSLIKPQPGPIVFQKRLVGATGGIVGKALEEDPLRLQERGFPSHPVVEGVSQTAAGDPPQGGDPVQIDEPDDRFVENHGKTLNPAPQGFGDQEQGAKALFEWIPKLFVDLLNLGFVYIGKPAPKNLLHLLKDFFIDRQDIIENAADAKHARFLNRSESGDIGFIVELFQ